MSSKKKQTEPAAPEKWIPEDDLPDMNPELGDQTPGFLEWFKAHPDADKTRIVNEILKRKGYPYG